MDSRHEADSDKVDKLDTSTNPEVQDTDQYVTGLKLAIIVSSVALACFLMLVDTMVISTVSQTPSSQTSFL